MQARTLLATLILTVLGAGVAHPDSAADERSHVAWGKPVSGLQAGLAIRDLRQVYRAGDRIEFEFRVRNLRQRAVQIARQRPDDFLPQWDGSRKLNFTPVSEAGLHGEPGLPLVLAAGEERVLDPQPLLLLTRSKGPNVFSPIFELRLEPGTYRLRCAAPVWARNGDEQRKLPATGEVEITVAP